MTGEKEDIVPRSFLEIDVAEKDEVSQQTSERKLRESKTMVELMDQSKGHGKDVVLEDKLDSGKESSKTRMEGRHADQEFANKVPRLDQTAETMSMIKKARVSVRARSDSSMVSRLYKNKMK